ncbi:nitroreductase [Sellimonas catena]|uniref:Diguanylate cyclase n=2 Tax=Bacillota TaxID=1239 RepID=A0A9W6C5P4_9FIRM|nr:nitroreductase [Sellimonas catena]GLG05571.1 diguanylate cyclase [Sellimonas catena]
MENNFLSLIKTRRSVRAYKPQPVPSEALDAVLEAGTYAPTGGGRQSPTIIAITDPKYRQEIARLNAEVMGNNTDPYYGAPVVILVLADGSANTFVEDGSCVLENMMLAAHALGLGTVWVHREREIFDSESGKALLREWKLPETLRGVGAIALGYPAKEAGQPAARKQNYIVRIECPAVRRNVFAPDTLWRGGKVCRPIIKWRSPLLESSSGKCRYRR